MNATASAEETPDTVRSAPRSKTSVPGIQRRFRDLRTGGSGVLRIAATMLRRLTRQAEKVTIRNVSSTPIRYATTRLRGWTSRWIETGEVERGCNHRPSRTQ